MKSVHTLFERPEFYNPNQHGAFSASTSAFSEKKRAMSNQKDDIMKKFREKMMKRKKQSAGV